MTKIRAKIVLWRICKSPVCRIYLDTIGYKQCIKAVQKSGLGYAALRRVVSALNNTSQDQAVQFVFMQELCGRAGPVLLQWCKVAFDTPRQMWYDVRRVTRR